MHYVLRIRQGNSELLGGASKLESAKELTEQFVKKPLTWREMFDGLQVAHYNETTYHIYKTK